jgi:hypothetical protein
MRRRLLILAAFLTLCAITPTAHAHRSHWSFGFYGGGPAYYAPPAPCYHYCAPPPPVYVRRYYAPAYYPQPVPYYYAPPRAVFGF